MCSHDDDCTSPGSCDCAGCDCDQAGDGGQVDVLVVDPSTLRITLRGEVAVVELADGTSVTVVEISGRRRGRAALAHTLDRLLDGRTYLTRTELRDCSAQVVRYRMGIYNPYTGQVALRPLRQTLVFSAQQRVQVDPAGTAAVWDTCTQTLTTCHGTRLRQVCPDYTMVGQAIEAHRQSDLVPI